MCKKIAVFVILMVNFTVLFCQEDSIRKQILTDENTKSFLIAKGRTLLLDKFLEGDIAKVKEIKDFLKTEENRDYMAFYPEEYWFILYWTSEYEALADAIQQFNPSQLYGAIIPTYDMLQIKLMQRSYEEAFAIKSQIIGSAIDDETKQFLLLHFEYLFRRVNMPAGGRDYRISTEKQQELNQKADDFLKNYPSSRYYDFISKYIYFKMESKSFGFGCNFLGGAALFNGQLGAIYTPAFTIGATFEGYYKNFELYLNILVGFNKNKKELEYSWGMLKEGSKTDMGLMELALGYAVYQNNYFKLTPFVGAGYFAIEENKKEDNKSDPLKATIRNAINYSTGINLDFKLGGKTNTSIYPKTSYFLIRVRYSFNIIRFERKYNNTNGYMHSVTIGIGGFIRGAKQVQPLM